MTITSRFRHLVCTTLVVLTTGCLQQDRFAPTASGESSRSATPTPEPSPTATPVATPAQEPSAPPSTPKPAPTPPPSATPNPHGEVAALLDSYVTHPAPAGGYIEEYVDPETIREDIHCPEIRVKWGNKIAQCWATLPRTNSKKQYNVGLQRHLKVFLFAEIAQDNRATPAGPVYQTGEFTGLTYKYFYCTHQGNWVTPDPDWHFDHWGGADQHCKAGPKEE